jgi:hypothetical protein
MKRARLRDVPRKPYAGKKHVFRSRGIAVGVASFGKCNMRSQKPSRMFYAVASQIRHENLGTWADRLGSSPTVDRVFRPWLPCRKPRHLMSMRARSLQFQRESHYASLSALTPRWVIHAESYRAKRRPSRKCDGVSANKFLSA